MPRKRTPQRGRGVVGMSRCQPTAVGGGGSGRGRPQGLKKRQQLQPMSAAPESQVNLKGFVMWGVSSYFHSSFSPIPALIECSISTLRPIF